jgi:hypothetical protein
MKGMVIGKTVLRRVTSYGNPNPSEEIWSQPRQSSKNEITASNYADISVAKITIIGD